MAMILAFFTILDNVLTVSESAEGEEGAGRLHPHPGDPLEGAGGGERVRNCRVAEIAEALQQQQQVHENCRQPY